MKLFFSHYVLHVLCAEKTRHMGVFDAVIEKTTDLSKIEGNALWIAPNRREIDKMLRLVKADFQPGLRSITLAVIQPKKVWNFIKKHFHAISAAGGVVEKENRVLLIYKRGCWDLPKGKYKAYERAKIAAIREVQEECGVQSLIIGRIGTTHHVLSLKGGEYGLKTTKWYRMKLTDDAHMQPQEEEGIEKVAWFEVSEAIKLLKSSYLSVNHVIQLWQLRLACSNAASAS